MGEKGLLGEILAQDSMNYYDLYLPLETQQFLFRILTIKLIFSSPDKYGFRLSKGDLYPVLSFDRVQVKCSQEIPIKTVAQAAKTRFKVIKDLNPEIRGHYLPKGDHDLLIPKGALSGFQARFSRLVKDFSESREGRMYVVQKGDNLSAIARRHNVPITALMIWNQIDLKAPIHPGQRVDCPSAGLAFSDVQILAQRFDEGFKFTLFAFLLVFEGFLLSFNFPQTGFLAVKQSDIAASKPFFFRGLTQAL